MKKETRRLWLDGLAMYISDRAGMSLEREGIYANRENGIVLAYSVLDSSKEFKLSLSDRDGNFIMLVIGYSGIKGDTEDIKVVSMGSGGVFAELGVLFLDSVKEFGLSDRVMRELRYKVKSSRDGEK